MFYFKKKNHEYFSIVFYVFHIRRQLFILIVDIIFQILINLNYDVVEYNDIKIENIKFSLFFNLIISFDINFFFENKRSFVVDITFNKNEKRIK